MEDLQRKKNELIAVKERILTKEVEDLKVWINEWDGQDV